MQIIWNQLPASLEEFTAASADLSRPEKTCALFLAALQCYLSDPGTGAAAVNLLRGPRPMTGYDTQFLRDRLRGKAYLPLAYFDGATPQNNYTPTRPYTLQVLADPRPQDMEPGYLRLYLKTAGADSPRPIKLRQKGNNWYLWEYSSVLSGIRVPVQDDPWA